jgi:hypothetical protein
VSASAEPALSVTAKAAAVENNTRFTAPVSWGSCALPMLAQQKSREASCDETAVSRFRMTV